MPNKQKKQSRFKVDKLEKRNKKLTSKEQKDVKGGLIIPGPHLIGNTFGGALSNTVGGALSNTVGGSLR